MLREWRVTLRSIVRRPGPSLIIVLTLAVSIGATSAIFSALDTVLLKPLPYPGADRLVAVYEANASQTRATSLVAPVRLEEWQQMSRAFEALAGSYSDNVTDSTGAVPERVVAVRTSPRFFSVLGTSAALGRTTTAEEERFGGPAAVVISDAYWRARFNADPTIVGRILTLGNQRRTIVGVMPASFRYPTANTQAWIPAQMPAGLMSARAARFYVGVGKLRPGVTIEQAREDLRGVQARLAEQFAKTDAGWTAALIPLKEEQIGGVRRSLWLLFGAVLLLLLAACGNIACLLLADAPRREQDMAVQFALGASRWTAIRQLLRECLVLAWTGSSFGLLLAHLGIDALRTLATRLPRAAEIAIDWRLVAFTLTMGVVTTILFGLVPALRATRRELGARLAHGGRGAVGGQQWLQRALVTAQVMLAIVLLVGAGLLIRSFLRLQEVSPGFDPAEVMTFRVSATWTERPENVVVRQFRTLQRLETSPGVRAAAIASFLPAGADFPPNQFTIVGRDTREPTFAVVRHVSASYFRVLRIPLLQGETCQDDPRAEAGPKVIVSRTFADRYFPGENPLGHRIVERFQGDIIGVVGDVRERGLSRTPEPTLYFCGLMGAFPDPYYMLRSDASGAVTVAALREVIREIEPRRALYSAATLTGTLSESLAQPRLNTLLLGLFAATALLLAAIGLYGMLAQFVSQRRREIGLRMALGAQPRHVLGQVVTHGALVTIAGVGLGLAGAFVLARVMATMVFGIAPRDPVTFALVPLALGVIAAIAMLIPARRAVKVDPMQALRDP